LPFEGVGGGGAEISPLFLAQVVRSNTERKSFSIGRSRIPRGNIPEAVFDQVFQVLLSFCRHLSPFAAAAFFLPFHRAAAAFFASSFRCFGVRLPLRYDVRSNALCQLDSKVSNIFPNHVSEMFDVKVYQIEFVFPTR